MTNDVRFGYAMSSAEHLAQAAATVAEMLAGRFWIGVGIGENLNVDAGFSHIYLHQVGPDQEGFFRFAERELLPRLEGRRASRRAA